jgi:hypothetical protein
MQQIELRVFRIKIIISHLKNAPAYYNAGVVAVNSGIAGLGPGQMYIPYKVAR